MSTRKLGVARKLRKSASPELHGAARELPDTATMAAHADSAATLLKALAHPARLLVMCRLVEGEASVSELQQNGVSMSALSQHLGVLRALGLVHTRRQSQSIYYSLDHGPALAIMRALYEAYCAPRAESMLSP